MVLRSQAFRYLSRGARFVALLCAAILGFGVVQDVQGQSPAYVVKKWSAADGLASTDIHGISRTPDGFLWIGTGKGLERFDGLQFSLHDPGDPAGLHLDSISDMVLGTDSTVYMSTLAGMAIFDERRSQIVVAPTKGKTDTVQVVLPVGRDEAWFGTMDGFLYHYSHGVTKTIHPELLSGSAIYGLVQAQDGTLWIGTGNGLFLMSHGQISRYRPKTILPINGFFDLAVSDAGSIFAATDHGVLQIAGNNWRFWTTKDGLPSDRIQVLAPAPGGDLWIGTTLGVTRLSRGRIETISTPPCSVGALNADLEDSVWVGCEHRGGLLQVKHRVLELVSAFPKTPLLRVSSIVVDKSGVSWMATANGLLRRQGDTSRLYTMKDGLPADNIYSVSLGSSGSVWMASENGFARMQNGKIDSFRTQEPGPEDPVFSILEDHAGTLWVGTATGLFSRPRGEAKSPLTERLAVKTTSIREDLEGRIWVSTSGQGLYEFNGSSVAHFLTGCGPGSTHVKDTLEDDHNDIWAATAKGLRRIRNGQCTSVPSEDDARLDDIRAFASDLRGHLWLRVQDKILAVDIAELDRVIDYGDKSPPHVWLFGGEDGFEDQLISVSTMNSVVSTSSGKMWFATAGGFGIIDPSILQTADAGLRPVITSIESDVGEHSLVRPISLKPGDLRVQFDYTAPSLNGAKSLEFRYQLFGFDKMWRLGDKQREAVYTSLPPGSYHFRVSARRPFGSWSDSAEGLEIRILPHFYQTWWWYALLASTLIATVFAGHQFRLREIRRQFATLMAERLHERSRLARELHDTLSQGMIGIHFQIEAAQVLLDVDPPSVRRHLENVGRIAREASIETRKSIAELRSDESRNTSLNAVIEELVLKFARTCIIDLSTEIEEELPQFSPEVIHEISRLLEEALANVRVHSMAQRAVLTARTSDKYLVLTVVDDGQGFQIDAPKDGGDGHFGITGMNERAARIDGRVWIESGTGRGTQVRLEIPLRARWNRSWRFFVPKS